MGGLGLGIIIGAILMGAANQINGLRNENDKLEEENRELRKDLRKSNKKDNRKNFIFYKDH